NRSGVRLSGVGAGKIRRLARRHGIHFEALPFGGDRGPATGPEPIAPDISGSSPLLRPNREAEAAIGARIAVKREIVTCICRKRADEIAFAKPAEIGRGRKLRVDRQRCVRRRQVIQGGAGGYLGGELELVSWGCDPAEPGKARYALGRSVVVRTACRRAVEHAGLSRRMLRLELPVQDRVGF